MIPFKTLNVPAMKTRAFLALAATALVVACTGVAPSSLKQSLSSEVLVLRDPVTWTHTEQSLRLTRDYLLKLKAGEYRAAFEDQGGRYYRGAPGCLSLHVVAATGASAGLTPDLENDCAVYFPFDNRKPGRVFVVIGSLRTQGGRAADRSVSVATSQDGVSALATQAAITGPSPVGVAGGAVSGAVAGAIIAADVGRLKEYAWGAPEGIPRAVFVTR